MDISFIIDQGTVVNQKCLFITGGSLDIASTLYSSLKQDNFWLRTEFPGNVFTFWKTNF